MLGISSQKNNDFLKNAATVLILTILFVIFVKPFSFDIGGEGVSGNYLFMLFPLLYYPAKFWGRDVVYSHQFYRPKLSILFFMTLLLCIFIVAFVYQSDYIEYSIRRTASFIAFMSIFTFMFVKIDLNMVRSFKYAIVIYSVYSSIGFFTLYFDLGGSELGTYAKGEVGSNRIGFVFIIALWIVYFLNSRTVLFTVLKHVVAVIIIIGLLLTFSRASTFALVTSLFVYLVVITLTGLKEGKSFRQLLKKLSLSVVYIVALSFLLGNLFPNTVVQNKRLIYDYIMPSEPTTSSTQTDTSISTQTDTTSLAVKDLTNKTTSLGYRVNMGNQIIDFVAQNPFTGSGFLGVWVMLDKVDGKVKGSAHGQFVDVLFRLGFIGFFVYIFFIYKILKFLYNKDSGLFIGFVGMLFYGLFHETFKLSQGAFIFAFLFAMYDQRKHWKEE